MPPEWNTRSMVQVPELLVSGLLHESDWPTLLGSTAFSRATLWKIIWLSEGARPLTKVSREWDDLGLRRRGQNKAYHERHQQAV
jgi:hypothetical protein